MTRRCLVVRGGWPGHDPVGTTDSFIPALEAQGFSVEIHESPEVYADTSVMAGVDLVVQSITAGEISADAVEGLRDAVAAGTGLVGWHAGLVAAFHDSLQYSHLLGALFVAHPGDGTGPEGSPAYRDYQVTFTPEGRSHVLTAGLDDFSVRTEQYWLLTDPGLHVLATTELVPLDGDEWAEPLTMPVAWTRQWGRGKIFTTTLGHTLEVVRRPEVVAMMERSFSWAAR